MCRSMACGARAVKEYFFVIQDSAYPYKFLARVRWALVIAKLQLDWISS